jgi:hypothetical protein
MDLRVLVPLVLLALVLNEFVASEFVEDEDGSLSQLKEPESAEMLAKGFKVR